MDKKLQHYYYFFRQRKWIPSYIAKHEDEILSIRFHPDGRFIATAGLDTNYISKNSYKWGRTLYVWDPTCQRYCDKLTTSHKQPLLDFCFSARGDRLYIACKDGIVSQYNFSTYRPMKKFTGHEYGINSINHDEEDKLLCTAGDDGTVRLWDTRTECQSHMFDINEYFPFVSVTFDSTGNRITAAKDNCVVIWDIRMNSVLKELNDHSGMVTGIAMSPDGSNLLSNSQDNTLRIWDMKTDSPTAYNCVRILRGHRHNVRQYNQLLRCAWSADGRYVSAGSADGVLYVWNNYWKTPMEKFPVHQGIIYDVDFHYKKNMVASCSSDKNIFWQNLDKLDTEFESLRKKRSYKETLRSPIA